MDKLKLKEYISAILKDKIEEAKINHYSIQDSVVNETKSSAGDKHETSRAMAQIELEKVGKQIFELEKNLHIFESISLEEKPKVGIGSLLLSETSTIFISIGIGKLNFEQKEVICISLASPLGQKLIGLKVGDSFNLGDKKQTILALK
jgi:transcription elongation GreA/GreB family factor